MVYFETKRNSQVYTYKIRQNVFANFTKCNNDFKHFDITLNSFIFSIKTLQLMLLQENVTCGKN